MLLAGVARVAIGTRAPFFVAVDAPFHIVAINHFYRSITHASQTMAGGTIYLVLNVNPVGKDDKWWKFIHPLPRNSFTSFTYSTTFNASGLLLIASLEWQARQISIFGRPATRSLST